MVSGAGGDDSTNELGEAARKAAMTRAEKDTTIQNVLGRYGHRVGKTVVEDYTCLGRLLATLQLDLEDREVGNYLCSFLVA
jgi:hypothetical protein